MGEGFSNFLGKNHFVVVCLSPAKVFLNRFTTSWVYYKIEDALHYVSQRQHEPLREYICRFQAIVAKIPNLDSRVKFSTIKFELKPRHFDDHIALTKPRDMAEFQEKVISFIEMEELREAKKADRKNIKVTVEDKKSRRANKKSEDCNRHKQDDGKGHHLARTPDMKGAHLLTLGEKPFYRRSTTCSCLDPLIVLKG
ncbi:hypothetical protein Cni_G06773 [Canna indica]|uniref:Retrotransposon gag domain-containing protein n=1 Tax=Canna indica TaxID=4628 RepID=A0AAQ3Q536_9LILI|nr:hypothetical protein Cni_G06773 [Canna indica]